MNSVEEKIIDILFKDLIIADVMVDKLLPKQIWPDKWSKEGFDVEDGFNMARDHLRSSIQEVIKK